MRQIDMRRILALPLLVYSAAAQMPHVGDVNYYGLHKLTPAAIEAATGIQADGPLPRSKGDLQDKLEQIPGVTRARVQAICCEKDRAALFIGIEEQGAPHPAFRAEPSGEASLPQDLMDRYRQFLTAVQRAAAHGIEGEDLTAGHSMMEDPAARAFQPRFVEFAASHFDVLRNTLHNGSDAETRAAAAAVIGYCPKKQQVVDELQFALGDPDPAVRANALRSLQAFIVYSQKQASAGLKISPTWFVDLLYSVELTDREESAKALVLMTDHGGQATLDLLRARARPDLAEMARWPTLRYAKPPFLLLARITGVPDDEAQQRWATGEREVVIQKALSADAAKPQQPGK